MNDAPQAGKGSRRIPAIWVALFFLLVWALFTHGRAGSANDRSRVAAIDSLVVRGTWVIDDSAFGRTVDRISIRDHFYSDKSPTLTWIGSGVYAVLNRALGLSFDASPCDFDEDPCYCRALCTGGGTPDWAYYLVTLATVGLPSALMLALFYHMTGWFGLSNPTALMLTAVLGLATPVFPYSTVLSSHVPAAACLLGGFFALLKAQAVQKTQREHWWLVVAGLLTALGATVDLGLVLFLAAFGGYAVWIHRQRAWWFVVGVLFPVALMACLNYQIVGNPLPAYLHTQGYDYPGSRFPRGPFAGNRGPQDVLIYGLRLLVGDRGLLALTPVLLWGCVALVKGWRDGVGSGPRQPLRLIAVVVVLTAGAFVLYFILGTDNFGGSAFGPRWYTPVVPLVFVFVAAKWKEMAVRGRRWVFFGLAALSLVNAYQGSVNPWRVTAPLLWVERAPSGWRVPVDAALSGITYEEIAPDLLAAFAVRRVDKRWFDARSCLVIPPGPTWFFIGPGTPLDGALAERSGLSCDGSVTTYVDLTPGRDAYLRSLTTTAWVDRGQSPSDPALDTAISLPADFGGQVALLGYEWLGGEMVAGGEVSLVTAWRVERYLEPPLAIFVHLLDSRGEIVGQVDGLGANPDGLRPGDVLLHVHRVPIASDARPGSHWLQIGLYDPHTMARLLVAGYDADRLLLRGLEIAD